MFPARHRAQAGNAAHRLSGKLTRTVVLATVATATAVTTGVVTGAADAGLDPTPTTAVATISAADRQALAESREQRATRSERRVSLQPKATDHEFATAALNVWTEPREQGKRVGLLKWGTKIAVTGEVIGRWAEVLLRRDGRQVARWVNNDYLAERKPNPQKSAGTASSATGISGTPCPDGSSIEAGLTSNADAVYRAVCAAFPFLSTYGGYSARGEHADGRAIDIMVSGSPGQAVADWLVANSGALRVRDVIFAQRIWTPEQASAGWRYMEDRGSATANHYDHVHVAVY